jgi:hypothetical protein
LAQSSFFRQLEATGYTGRKKKLERGKEVLPEVEYLDEIQTKIFKVFLIAIYSYLYTLQLCLEISISSNSRNLSQFLLYTVKEKGGKPDRKPYLLSYGLRNPYRNLKPENSQDYSQRHQ